MTDDEYAQLALRSYSNPGKFTVYEFATDLRRIAKLSTLISEYQDTGEEFNVRAIVNSIVITANCFGVKPAMEMIRCKTSKENLDIINSCFVFLGWSDPASTKIDQFFLDSLGAL